MSDSCSKRCVVAYATPARQYLWTVRLSPAATVAQALEAARLTAAASAAAGGEKPPPVPWEASDVGIFGELVGRDHVPAAGDRIEIYRPLQHDPRQARRERARRLRSRR